MPKATVAIEIEFVGTKADAEGIAGAMDMIVKTGLESLQRELEQEYGVTKINPSILIPPQGPLYTFDKIEEKNVIDILHTALNRINHPNINDVSFDGDHKSAEIIITTEDKDGTKRDWVVSSSGIHESDREYDPEG